MNYTVTSKVCKACAREKSYFGFRTLIQQDDESNYCSSCGKEHDTLFVFHVPEINIKFFTTSTYRFWNTFTVKVNERFIRDDAGQPISIGYTTADVPKSLEEAQAAMMNVHSQEEYWLNIGAWANTVKLEGGGRVSKLGGTPYG